MAERHYTPIPPLTENQIARFRAKFVVGNQNECWLWRGSINNRGYGRLNLYNCRVVYAHRISYLLHYGKEPQDLFIMHTCDNPPCVNPHHLRAGTHTDNMRDAIAKGRNATGERHGSKTHPERIARGDRSGSRTHPERLRRGDNHPARLYRERWRNLKGRVLAYLTEEQVISIRSRHTGNQNDTKELAAEFNVCPQTIRRIIKRQIWKNI